MTPPSPLLDTARIALEQGSLDQAASICDAALADAAADPDVVSAARDLQDRIDVARQRPDRPLHVVIIGDSLAIPRPENPKTYDPRSSPALAPAYPATYPALLRRALASEHAPREVSITTMCRSSNGMLDVAADAYVGLFYLDPAVVVVHCGIVDLWPRDEEGVTGPRTDAEAFAAALQRFLTTRREYCATKPVIFVGVAPTDARWIERLPGIERTIEAYNAILAAAAGERTAFIDLAPLIATSGLRRGLHTDGIHLNALGHAALATAIADAIRALGT